MSTRSEIARINSDGTVNEMYCHFDGYFSGVGRDLINRCNNQKKVNLLFSPINIEEGIDEIPEVLDKPVEEDELSPNYSCIDDFVNHYKDDIFIEYLYIWIPGSKNIPPKEKIENLLDKTENLTYEDLQNIEGIWVCCDNCKQYVFYKAKNACEVELALIDAKLEDKVEDLSKICRIELYRYWYANYENDKIFSDETTKHILKKYEEDAKW
jgi:hypothetical protein